MLNVSRDIHSLTDFRRNTARYVEQMRETGAPVVLTVNGKAELVVLTAELYQRLHELADQMEALEGIRRGLDEADAGKGTPLAEAFDVVRKEHELRNRGSAKRAS